MNTTIKKNRIVIAKKNPGKTIFKKIKNTIWWTFMRRLRRSPEQFFYFPSNHKYDHEIRGYHWSGQIRIFRTSDESIKSWNAFCFHLVYNSRKNRYNA